MQLITLMLYIYIWSKSWESAKTLNFGTISIGISDRFLTRCFYAFALRLCVSFCPQLSVTVLCARSYEMCIWYGRRRRSRKFFIAKMFVWFFTITFKLLKYVLIIPKSKICFYCHINHNTTQISKTSCINKFSFFAGK